MTNAPAERSISILSAVPAHDLSQTGKEIRTCRKQKPSCGETLDRVCQDGSSRY